jgi:hypothetical protein
MGGGHHTADEHALEQAQDQKQDRRGDADLGDRRQQAECRRGQPDPDDRDDHGAPAAVLVRIIPEQGRPDRPHEQRHRKRGVNRCDR